MFSMKIGFAAFDQPGQLNRPFNYPIRYTYIYILASLESPRLEERTIGPNWLALHAMFHLLFNFVRTMDEAFVRTVTLFGSIPFYWRTSIHPLDPWNGTILQQTTSFFTISIVLNLIRFPVVRWKVIDARSILIFTTSLLVRQRIRPRRTIHLDWFYFILFIYLFILFYIFLARVANSSLLNEILNFCVSSRGQPTDRWSNHDVADGNG